MTQTVQLEDGSIHEFPDDATQDEMNSLLPPPPDPLSATSNFSNAVQKGYTNLGLGLINGGNNIGDLTGAISPDDAAKNRQIYSNTKNDVGQQLPTQPGISRWLGNMLGANAPALLAGPIAGPLVGGAALGATEALSNEDPSQMTPGNQAIDVGKNSALYALLGKGTDMAMKGVYNVFNPAPTAQQLREIAGHYYTAAAQSGDTFPSTLTDSLIDKTASQAPQTLAGKATIGTSPVSDLVSRWGVLRGQPLDMSSVQEMDEGLGSLIDKEVQPNGRLSKAGKDLMDTQTNFRNMVMDHDTAGGDALQNARQAWAQGAKMSDLEKIQTRADLSDNPATTIKSGIRTLLSNPARTRGWSPDEVSVLKSAADRGALGGTLHVFGSRLIPLITGMVGESVGGPVGAMVGAGLGQGGSSLMRSGATAIQNSKLNDVFRALGKNAPPRGNP